MKDTIKVGYECGNCNNFYEDKYDAQECCPPEVDKVFQCTECEETFEYRDDADKHVFMTHTGAETRTSQYLDMLRFGNMPVVEAQRIFDEEIVRNDPYVEKLLWGK